MTLRAIGICDHSQLLDGHDSPLHVEIRMPRGPDVAMYAGKQVAAYVGCGSVALAPEILAASWGLKRTQKCAGLRDTKSV